MAIQCPACGRGYDVTLFQFGKGIRCVCGRDLDLSHHVETDDGSEADGEETVARPEPDERG